MNKSTGLAIIFMLASAMILLILTAAIWGIVGVREGNGWYVFGAVGVLVIVGLILRVLWLAAKEMDRA